MKYMLDSNICIYIMNERPKHILDKFRTLSECDVSISSVVLSELNYGAHKSHHKEKNLVALEKFTVPVQAVSYDAQAASHFGEIRVALERQGLVIGPYDLMIAAHALSVNATLITNNLKEFSRVKNLRCEKWS